eukprot:3831130-Pyramimonas_sp.AAC.1
MSIRAQYAKINDCDAREGDPDMMQGLLHYYVKEVGDEFIEAPDLAYGKKKERSVTPSCIGSGLLFPLLL